MLLADHRAAHDDPPQGGEEHQVDEGLALGPHPGALEPLPQLLAGSAAPPRPAPSIVSIPRSAAASETPSWRSRRVLLVSSGGVVSACSRG